MKTRIIQDERESAEARVPDGPPREPKPQRTRVVRLRRLFAWFDRFTHFARSNSRDAYTPRAALQPNGGTR